MLQRRNIFVSLLWADISLHNSNSFSGMYVTYIALWNKLSISSHAAKVGLISQTGSVYLTICVTMERYMAVCHPLKAKYLCTYGRAKIYVLLTAFFSIGKYRESMTNQTSVLNLRLQSTEILGSNMDPNIFFNSWSQYYRGYSNIIET